MKDTQQLTSVVIAGGGTAGWLTACILAAKHRPGNLSITVIESPDIPTLGVGEGTWPTMRGTLQKIGIDEATFLSACHGSFKQGTSFHHWRKSDASPHQYYHPFSLPFNYFDTDCAAWWQRHQPQMDFASVATSQGAICDRNLAPKQAETPPFAGVVNYGYHLDAVKFAGLLKHRATSESGVTHITGHISSVIPSEDGGIHSVVLDKTGREIEGDIFIDCTGFSARLIGEHCGEPLISCKHILANDSAVAVQCQYAADDTPVASVTRSVAQSKGWIWDIALPERRGAGYVYSSQHCTAEEAILTLHRYAGSDKSLRDVSFGEFSGKAKYFNFEPGYRRSPWQKNCVAIGTSAGFLEPLEASALVMIELAATLLSDQFPRYTNQIAPVARQFNQQLAGKWSRIVDFLKLHYVLSDRDDSAYWQEMRKLSSCSEQLQDWLSMWSTRSPNASDFNLRDEIFPAASYLYVLYGMGFNTAFLPGSADHDSSGHQHAWHKQQQLTRQHLAGLPANRALLTQLTGARQYQVNK